jgi:hypothetical protein
VESPRRRHRAEISVADGKLSPRGDALYTIFVEFSREEAAATRAATTHMDVVPPRVTSSATRRRSRCAFNTNATQLVARRHKQLRVWDLQTARKIIGLGNHHPR